MVFTPHDSESFNQFMKDVRHYRTLSSEEEKDLARRIKKGDNNARNKLVTANLRFLIKKAKEYLNKGLSLQDLIDAGAVGLIQAAELFDEGRNCKFITYAGYWIQKSITDALRENWMIHIPINKYEQIRQIDRLQQNALQLYERELSDYELAEELNMSLKEVKDCLQAMTMRASLDAPLAAGGECIVEEEFAPDDYLITDCHLDHYSIDENQDVIKMFRRTLKERDYEILSMSFGLEGAPYSTQEIADHFGTSDERVRQIKNRALDKLRTSSNNRLLHHYLCG